MLGDLHTFCFYEFNLRRTPTLASEPLHSRFHPSEQGRILGAQHTDSVADFLRTFTGQEGEAAQPAVISEFVKPLKSQPVTL